MIEVGDTVVCIKSIHEPGYGPQEGEVFLVTCAEPGWIGFVSNYRESSPEENAGEETRWAADCFRVITPAGIPEPHPLTESFFNDILSKL
jgi:hypothetical protein